MAIKFSSFKPYDADSMDTYISAGKSLQFSRANNMFKAKTNNVIAPTQTIVCMYYDSLSPYITEREFSDAEIEKYRYNPRFLSYDLYGTPELWADILYINNMVSVTQFKFSKSKIRIFTNSIIDALLEIKLIIENDLEDNKNSIGKN